MKLDDFTQGYVHCMLWSETDQTDESGGDPLDRNYGVEDFDPETLQAIVEDCQQFQEVNREAINTYPAKMNCLDGYTYTGNELAGHDYWLTRNGHGTGYWDREYLPQWAKDSLDRAAQQAGEVWVYVGDDGRLYL
jgi:hypothetical protein